MAAIVSRAQKRDMLEYKICRCACIKGCIGSQDNVLQDKHQGTALEYVTNRFWTCNDLETCQTYLERIYVIKEEFDTLNKSKCKKFYLCEIFFSCLFCFVAIMVLREEGMETVCLHFGSTLPRCLEAAAKGKTTSTAQGKLPLYTICRHFIFHHGVVLLSLCGQLVTDD